MKDCLSNHPECQRFSEQSSFLPTRVLDLGHPEDDQPPKLHISHPEDRASYAALSHRWGSTKPVITTLNNLSKRIYQIPYSEMSKTFQDAIAITKTLGIRYLWIDSLCIVQDSADDWASESVKMGTTYRNALVTIAAVQAEDSSMGCFVQRDGLKSRPCKLNIDVGPDVFLKGGTIHACSSHQVRGDILRHRGPLDTRAWVLQEQLLSPRVLNYGNDGIYWECLRVEASERVPEGFEIEYEKDSDYVQKFKRGIGKSVDLKPPLTEIDFHRLWYLIVQDYSRRLLSKESDRMAALLGVVTAMTESTHDKFVAGLWSTYFVIDLLWCVYGPGCPTLGGLQGFTGPHGPMGTRTKSFKGTYPFLYYCCIVANSRSTFVVLARGQGTHPLPRKPS